MDINATKHRIMKFGDLREYVKGNCLDCAYLVCDVFFEELDGDALNCYFLFISFFRSISCVLCMYARVPTFCSNDLLLIS